MNYFEARGSGKPFNRKKYKDDWYIYDQRRNIDFSRIDLSQRFWSSDDLNADDWWTVEMHNAELGMSDQDRLEFWKWWGTKPYSSDSSVSDHGNTWQIACIYKQEEIDELIGYKKEFEKYLKAFHVELEVKRKLQAENAKLKREIEVLRLYGNKDCTAMADEVLENE